MGKQSLAMAIALLSCALACAQQPAQQETEDVVQVVKGEAKVNVVEEFQGTRGQVPVYCNEYHAQSFTAKENTFKVEFTVSARGKPEGLLRVEIFPTEETGTGPSRTNSVASNTLSAGTTPKNFSLSFPVGRLKAGQRYWVVWRSTKPADNPGTGSGYLIAGGESEAAAKETMALFDGSVWRKDSGGRDLYLKLYTVSPPGDTTIVLGKTYPVRMLTDATLTTRKDGTVSYFYFDNFRTEKVFWDARCDNEVFIKEGEQPWLAARCLAESSAVCVWKVALPFPGTISFDVHHNNYTAEWCTFFRRTREGATWEKIDCGFDGAAWNWDMDPRVVLTPAEGTTIYLKAIIAGDPNSGPGASGGLMWLKLFGTLTPPR